MHEPGRAELNIRTWGQVRHPKPPPLTGSGAAPYAHSMSLWLALFLLAAPAEERPAPAALTEAPIIPGAIPLSEPGRYQSPRNYPETLDYYRRLFARTGGVRWRNIVNQPDIRAKHAASLRRKTRWQGLNIYEKQGHVRIYVVQRPLPTEGTQPP
jgi:hypothetical protein